MQSISTKTGDNGQTSLANGQRVAKNSPIITALGTLDELNSWLGLVVAQLGTTFGEEKEVLEQQQQNLYQISAELAQAPKAKFKKSALTQLEKQADSLQESMVNGWHSKFLYPGGTLLGAYLDLGRAVCRRAERVVTSLKRQHSIPETILHYLNRLSDYLYLLRCYINLYQKHSEKQLQPDK